MRIGKRGLRLAKALFDTAQRAIQGPGGSARATGMRVSGAAGGLVAVEGAGITVPEAGRPGDTVGGGAFRERSVAVSATDQDPLSAESDGRVRQAPG
jgi:hypothetical protein